MSPACTPSLLQARKFALDLTGHRGCTRRLSKSMKQAFSAWGRAEHLAAARLHVERAKRHGRAYEIALNQAALSLFGRAWYVSDYRVSGIGRDEFTNASKDKLRHHLHRLQQHCDLADAHLLASGKHMTTAVRQRRALMS
jgi:hypothetical protein